MIDNFLCTRLIRLGRYVNALKQETKKKKKRIRKTNVARANKLRQIHFLSRYCK